MGVYEAEVLALSLKHDPRSDSGTLEEFFPRVSPVPSRTQRGMREGDGEAGSLYFVGIECPFGKIKRFWRWMGLMVVEQCEST